jgi:uncharacterized protein YqcC (DUF446 family)
MQSEPSVDRNARVLAQLDAIEREMRRIGFWAQSPPDLAAEVQSGRIKSYLDAPSFELWLQCTFIPNAREAAANDRLPGSSQVGVMAMREYDYHSSVPEARALLNLLFEFDRIVEGRLPR